MLKGNIYNYANGSKILLVSREDSVTEDGSNPAHLYTALFRLHHTAAETWQKTSTHFCTCDNDDCQNRFKTKLFTQWSRKHLGMIQWPASRKARGRVGHPSRQTQGVGATLTHSRQTKSANLFIRVFRWHTSIMSQWLVYTRWNIPEMLNTAWVVQSPPRHKWNTEAKRIWSCDDQAEVVIIAK